MVTFGTSNMKSRQKHQKCIDYSGYSFFSIENEYGVTNNVLESGNNLTYLCYAFFSPRQHKLKMI